MDQPIDNLAAECQRALDVQARDLSGETVDASERQEFEAHLAACSVCRAMQQSLIKTDESLRMAFSQTRASSGFAARTLAALPTMAEVASAPVTNTPRVFSAGPARRSWGAGLSVAAALVAAVLVAVTAISWKRGTPHSKNNLSVRRGKIMDSNGQVVTQLKPGTLYRVVEADSVVPLNDANLLNIKENAEFQINVAADTGEQSLKLQSGDLFAWGKEENDQKPLKVSCSTFDTLLNAGDFFVAEDGADDAGTVVIVFKGQAQVKRDNQTLPLRAGQVFFMLGSDDMAFAQTLELTDAVGRLRDDPGVRRQDLVELRNLYEKQINGYKKELVELESLLKTEKNEHKLAELRKRQQLVVSYRDEHQRKLKTLFREFPYEELQRGLHGHSDPATWL